MSINGATQDTVSLDGSRTDDLSVLTTSADEKAPDSSDPAAQSKNPKAPKPKKRKKVKDTTAPRQPLTGYVRFLNDRRDTVKANDPSLSFADITKLLANEWTHLAADRKQQYLDAAELDRERYAREFDAYKLTDAYKQFTMMQNEQKLKEAKEPDHKMNSIPVVITNQTNNAKGADGGSNELGNVDIPIFTEEFLEHNKLRDTELRQLRKATTDYEQQNAVLEKHIDNMKDAISKLETEIVQQEKNNESLQKHLLNLRVTLTKGFSGVKLPGIKEMATQDNIDSYMNKLHSVLLESNDHDSTLVQTVRNIVGTMEFNG